MTAAKRPAESGFKSWPSVREPPPSLRGTAVPIRVLSERRRVLTPLEEGGRLAPALPPYDSTLADLTRQVLSRAPVLTFEDEQVVRAWQESTSVPEMIALLQAGDAIGLYGVDALQTRHDRNDELVRAFFRLKTPAGTFVRVDTRDRGADGLRDFVPRLAELAQWRAALARERETADPLWVLVRDVERERRAEPRFGDRDYVQGAWKRSSDGHAMLALLRLVGDEDAAQAGLRAFAVAHPPTSNEFTIVRDLALRLARAIRQVVPDAPQLPAEWCPIGDREVRSPHGWAALRTAAFGRPDGQGQPDVAAALEILRFGDASDDDEAMREALDDVLLGHVWNQGTVSPIAGAVVPFVIDLVDESPALAEDPELRHDTARFVLLVSAAAERASPETRDAIHAALKSRASALREWARGDLADVAIVTLLNIPALVSEAHDESLVTRADRLWAVASHLPFVGQDARNELEDALAERSHPVIAQARELVRRPELDHDDLERLAAVIAAIGASDWQVELDELRERFGILAPRQSQVAPGETRAKVHMAMPDIFVARASTDVTVRWKHHPFVEGDTVVLVDINERNVPLEVRGTDEKAAFVGHFDKGGKLLGPP